MAKATQLDARFERLGEQVMEGFPPGVRAYLCMQATLTSPFEELWRSGSEQPNRGGDADRILEACRKRQRTVIVFNAENDSNLRDIPTRTFRSALCTPILDETKTPMALLLLTSEQSETFVKNHAFVLERFARDYTSVVETHRKVVGKNEKESSPFDFLYSPMTLMAALTVLLVLIGWSLAPGDPEPAPHPTEIPNSTVGPTEVAEDFLRRLQEGRYDEAWALLDPALRQRWSSADFRQTMEDWARRESNHEILSARGPSRVQRQDRQVKVLLYESTVAGDRGRWNWELSEQNGEWKISGLEGPVTGP